MLKHTPPHQAPDRRRRTVDFDTIQASHPELGDRFLYCEPATLLFTENETNTERLFGTPNQIPYVKDAFHRYLIQGETDAVNPARRGTKAAPHYPVEVPSGGEMILRLRLSDQRPQELTDPIGL